MVSSPVSLDTSMAAMEEASRLYFRISECKSTKLVSANDETLHPGCILDVIVLLLLANQLYNAHPKKDTKAPPYDKLSISIMKETVVLVTDLLRPRDHAVVFYTAQQFSIRHRLLGAVPSKQHDGLSFSSSFE